MFSRLVGLSRYACRALGALALSACSFSALALPVLPAPNCGIGANFNCLTFGDFSVYSLAYLNFSATGDNANPKPGDPFYVKSSPGELQLPGYIVYGTGTNNNGVVTNVPNVDNAFSTPEGSVGSFSTATAGEPIPNGFAGDNTNRWDADLAAMRTELGVGNQFAIYFNLNETGNDNLQGIDLLVWMTLTLEDALGNTQKFVLCGGPFAGGCQALAAPNETKVWSTANGGMTYVPPLGGATQAPNGNPGDPNDPAWTYVHGTICAVQTGATTTFLHFGPCTAADPAGAKSLDQNLGANAAAFAIYNPIVNDAVTNPNSPWKYMHIDWKMAQENNGYEQAFSALNTQEQQLPEPGTLALLGLGVFAAAWVRRTRVSRD